LDDPDEDYDEDEEDIEIEDNKPIDQDSDQEIQSIKLERQISNKSLPGTNLLHN
jgi:hypothetical protein